MDVRLHLDVCAWQTVIYNALMDKIVDDAEEMAAFMLKGLESYFLGKDYGGYDAEITNQTLVEFIMATTTTTAISITDPTSTDNEAVVSMVAKDESIYEELMGYWLPGSIGLAVVCCYIVVIMFYFRKRQHKMQQVELSVFL